MRVRGRLQSKKSMELTVNFLVVFILAIIIFSLSIIFVKNMFYQSQGMVGDTRASLMEKLHELRCTPREIVCISSNNQIATPDSTPVIGVHIFNIETTKMQYTIVITPRKGFDAKQNALDPSKMVELIGNTETLLINPKKQGDIAFGFAVEKNTIRGEYMYVAQITGVDAADPNGPVIFTRSVPITLRIG